MSVSINCPSTNCGQSHTVSNEDIGKTVPCSHCGSNITVTPPSDPAVKLSLANFIPNLERLTGTPQARMLLWAGLAALTLLALSAFLPWASVLGYSVLGIRVGAGVCQLLLSLAAIAFIVATILVNNAKLYQISLWSAAGWCALAALWRVSDLLSIGQFAGIGLYLGLLAALGAAASMGTIAVRRVLQR